MFQTKELYFGEVQSLGPRRIELRSCWLPARHFVISAVQPLQAGNFKLPIKCSSIVFNLENLFRFHCLINVFLKKFFKNMKKIRNRILDLIHTVLTCGGRGKMSGHWVRLYELNPKLCFLLFLENCFKKLVSLTFFMIFKENMRQATNFWCCLKFFIKQPIILVV